MLVPYNEISTEALTSLIKEWVIANINEADHELNIDKWSRQVLNQVKNGEMFIEYSEESESVGLKTKEEVVFV